MLHKAFWASVDVRGKQVESQRYADGKAMDFAAKKIGLVEKEGFGLDGFFALQPAFKLQDSLKQCFKRGFAAFDACNLHF